MSLTQSTSLWVYGRFFFLSWSETSSGTTRFCVLQGTKIVQTFTTVQQTSLQTPISSTSFTSLKISFTRKLSTGSVLIITLIVTIRTSSLFTSQTWSSQQSLITFTPYKFKKSLSVLKIRQTTTFVTTFQSRKNVFSFWVGPSLSSKNPLICLPFIKNIRVQFLFCSITPSSSLGPLCRLWFRFRILEIRNVSAVQTSLSLRCGPLLFRNGLRSVTFVLTPVPCLVTANTKPFRKVFQSIR